MTTIREEDDLRTWVEAQAFKIIGIDPAPSKHSHVFDGQSMQIMDQSELQQYLAELKEAKTNVLVCWDAPLARATNRLSDFLSCKFLTSEFGNYRQHAHNCFSNS